MRKHLKQKCKSGRAKAGAKSDKAKQELEGKFPPFPFLGFFLCCFPVCFVFSMFEKKKMMARCYCLLLWCYCNEKGDGNLLPLPFSLCLRKKKKKTTLWPSFLCLRKRQWHDNVLSFSSVAVFQ